MSTSVAVLSGTDLPAPFVAVLDELRRAVCEPSSRASFWEPTTAAARRRALAATLAAGQQAGQVPAGLDVDALAAEIVAMRDGLLLQWAFDPDAVDVLALMEDHLRRIQPTR